MEKLEELLLISANEAPLDLQLACQQLVQSGGKRVRPRLMFFLASLTNDLHEEHVKAAACVELIHTATLFHDDVMDNSDLRRNLPTAHRVWSKSHSILAGDFLLCKALSLLTKLKNWPALESVQKAALNTVQGQALEIQKMTGNLIKDESIYWQVITLKTASLFSCAAELAGILSGGDQKTTHDMFSFGKNLGIYFQVMDDLIDYVGTEELLGKPVGQDWQEKKTTLPLILAYKNSEKKDQDFIDQAWPNPSKEGSLKKVLDIFQKTKTIEKTLAQANSYFLQLTQTSVMGEKITNNSAFKNILASIQKKVPKNFVS